MSAKLEWEAMSPEQQLAMLERMVGTAARKRGMHVSDVAEYVGDVWELLTAYLADESVVDSLSLLAYRAAAAAVLKEHRHKQKHIAASIREIENESGGAVNAIETLIASGRDSTEDQAIIRAEYEKALLSLNRKDRRIINRLAAGFSAREIALEIGMSHTAINKRVAKIRRVLTVEGLA